MAREFRPLCMSADELAAWREMNLRLIPKTRADRPCADCPIAFAQSMRLEMKCNGTPRLRATPSKHTARRLLQWREAQARKRQGIRIRRTPAERAVMISRIGEMYADGLSTRDVVLLTGVSSDYARDARMRAEARAA